MNSVPAIRIRSVNRQPLRSAGSYVLYWMIAARRLTYNFALDRAIEHAHTLRKPLLIFEALRCGYPWASDRIHKFVLQGMADNAANSKKYGVAYFAYVEHEPGGGKGLLEALAAEASIVVTDDFPCFFLPRMVAAAAKKLSVQLEAVDSNGLLPLRAAKQVYARAFDFRRFLQKELPAHLHHFPAADPLKLLAGSQPAKLPPRVAKKWPHASSELLAGDQRALQRLPIDHSVTPASTPGGSVAANLRLAGFLKRFDEYAGHRNEPERDATSGLSPYLHFGYLSVHQVFAALARLEKWKPEKISIGSSGSRDGWWHMSPAAESFLDELITWREVGFNFCLHRTDYDQYDSLPDWALRTLKSHARDERSPLYSLHEFESAQTHDALWNAAQLQLVLEGRIHNYLRMLWGKKILEWSKSPQDALRIMIHLNNKYGLDGRDPNSYTGIFWVLGRYDRPWAPERPVFGVVRYMSSENTARKFRVKNYIARYSPGATPQKSLQFSAGKT